MGRDVEGDVATEEVMRKFVDVLVQEDTYVKWIQNQKVADAKEKQSGKDDTKEKKSEKDNEAKEKQGEKDQAKDKQSEKDEAKEKQGEKDGEAKGEKSEKDDAKEKQSETDEEAKGEQSEKDDDVNENQSRKETNRHSTQNRNNEPTKGGTNITDARNASASTSTSNASNQEENQAKETPSNSVCVIIVLTSAFLQSPWFQGGQPSALLQKLMAAYQEVIILKLEDGLDFDELFPNVPKAVCNR